MSQAGQDLANTLVFAAIRTYRVAMVRRAYLMVGLAAAAVVMTLVVASISNGSVLGNPRRPGPAVVTANSPPEPPHRIGLHAPILPDWLVRSLTALLVLYAVGLITLLILSRRAKKRLEEQLILTDNDEPAGSDWGALLSVELGRATDEELAELVLGTPRNAIVACWMRLQEVTHGAGLPVEVSETSQEFTVRALRRLQLNDTAISTLSRLYREARFSEHEMVEVQRDQARAALQVLADELSSPAASRAEPKPDLERSDLDSLAL